ncbi:MAG: HEAT repeat domain-containing protein, partial [Chitinophagaceae bacterium]
GKYFKMPLAIDVYEGPAKKRYNVWISNPVDSFTFSYAKRPDLVNVDADKVMLWTKKENKTLDNYIHQYKYAGNYVDRREAIDYAAARQTDPKAIELLKTALSDRYKGLRNYAIFKLDMKKDAVKAATEETLASLAKNDPYSVARASAIQKLGDLKNPAYAAIFKAAVNDSSYTVAGNALSALSKTDPAAAAAIVKQLAGKPAKGVLREVVMNEVLKAGDESMAEKIIGDFAKMPMSQAKFETLNGLSTYLAAIKNTDKIKWGVDEIVKFRDGVPEAFKGQTDPYINGMILKGLLADKQKKAKENAGDAALQQLVEYIKSKLPEEDKKGF